MIRHPMMCDCGDGLRTEPHGICTDGICTACIRTRLHHMSKVLGKREYVYHDWTENLKDGYSW